MENLLKSLAVFSLISGGILTVGALLYWEAYRKMKKSPIIGCVAGVLTIGAITSFFSALCSLFPNKTHLLLLCISKIVLGLMTLLFIKVSLSPQKDHIRKFEKDVKEKLNVKKG